MMLRKNNLALARFFKQNFLAMKSNKKSINQGSFFYSKIHHDDSKQPAA